MIKSKDKNVQILITILQQLRERINNDTDITWTSYNSQDDLAQELDNYLEQLNDGNLNCLEKIEILFAPTSTFQELSISNNWSKEYLKLSNEFDKILFKG